MKNMLVRCFWKKNAYIWSTIQLKQQYCEILLQFKITVFYCNIYSNVIYSSDGKSEFSADITSVFIVTQSF